MSYKVVLQMASILTFGLLTAGCEKKSNPADEAPPEAQVVKVSDSSLFKVDDPKKFPLVAATTYSTAGELKVTGAVTPDVSQTVPVNSMAHGRIVGIFARLGDNVKKGQLLLKIQSPDISAAVAAYHKAVADEHLASVQLERQKLLYDKGAVAKTALEMAENTEADAKTTLEDSLNQLRALGGTIDHANDIVNVYAPVSGVIVEQNVTQSAGVKTMDNAPNLFTIANLSHVWIVCDVYENDLADVHLGDTADIRLNAYPDKALKGKISDIGPVLDPTIRTAKVRIEVPNPGLMRVGMFVTAVFRGRKQLAHATVPATAVLHLHDRDWVYIPADGGFKRLSVVAGNMLPGGLQEIVSGLEPGQQVVTNALSLQSTVEQ